MVLAGNFVESMSAIPPFFPAFLPSTYSTLISKRRNPSPKKPQGRKKTPFKVVVLFFHVFAKLYIYNSKNTNINIKSIHTICCLDVGCGDGRLMQRGTQGKQRNHGDEGRRRSVSWCEMLGDVSWRSTWMFLVNFGPEAFCSSYCWTNLY